MLTEFLNGETLKCALHHTKSNVTYTYESKSSGQKSLIDHFVLSENLFDRILCYDTLSEIDNLST